MSGSPDLILHFLWRLLSKSCSCKWKYHSYSLFTIVRFAQKLETLEIQQNHHKTGWHDTANRHKCDRVAKCLKCRHVTAGVKAAFGTSYLPLFLGRTDTAQLLENPSQDKLTLLWLPHLLNKVPQRFCNPHNHGE